MLNFLKEQYQTIESELKELYKSRAKASVETIGSYDIMINRKKVELQKLQKEIQEATPKQDTTPISPTEKSGNDPKVLIRNLVLQNNIPEAIDMMQKQWDTNETILLAARYNGLLQRHNQGILSHNQFNLQYNQIVNSLLGILKEL